MGRVVANRAVSQYHHHPQTDMHDKQGIANKGTARTNKGLLAHHPNNSHRMLSLSLWCAPMNAPDTLRRAGMMRGRT